MKHGAEWYKREPAAYLGGVQGLTAQEHAVYSVILDLIYQHGGAINCDAKWVAGWISDMGAAAVRNATSSLVAKGKLEMVGEKITQKRAKNEVKTREKLSEIRAEMGKNGGLNSGKSRSKGNENKAEDEANASCRGEAIRLEGELELEKKEVAKATPVVSGRGMVMQCLDHFNATAETVGWPRVQKLTDPRRAALTQRIKDCGGAVAWREAITRAATSPLLTGQKGTGWRADFDWLCKPANFTKLMEGNYDPPQLPPATPNPTNGVKNERLAFDKALNAAIKATPPGASLVDRSRSDPFAKR